MMFFGPSLALNLFYFYFSSFFFYLLPSIGLLITPKPLQHQNGPKLI